ncbi:hypothetical protein [Roseivirga pacifica]|uniref:hypothetical protein n=1 Tax=Roseivirga pacifica TaxID=1267423 RepID=UPI003BABB7E1
MNILRTIKTNGLEVLQLVEASQTKLGQKVKFKGKRAWWTVHAKENQWVVLTYGKTTKRVSLGYPLLQEMFENLW